MPLVRRFYASHGLSNDATDLIMASWRPGTKAQYSVYLKLWSKFFEDRKLPYRPTLKFGIEFLTFLFSEGYSYPQIAMARSALSSVIVMNNASEFTFGKHTLVKRLMKGIFEKRPTFPKFHFIWNVQTLFNYFRSLDHPAELPMGILGKKLALLIGIVAGGHRSQTLHAIRSTEIKVLGDRCIIPIYEPIKQTRPGRHLKPLEFPVYLENPKLCVVENLKQYLAKTSAIRQHSQLFISYQKPHQPVSKDTLARWCKQVLGLAGIDIDQYSAHSSRSATTFARFYQKTIDKPFETHIL